METKHQRVNKISKRIVSLNSGIIVLILIGVIAFSTIAITGVVRSASMQLAHIHSLASVRNFMLYASSELTLLRRAANLEAVQAWFADEENEAKREAAFNELIASAALLQSAEFYFGILASLNEYSIDISTTIGEFLPYGRMAANEPMDAWFFDLLDSDKNFLFNIDVDKVDHRWRIWLNYEVVYDGKAVGVLSTSLRIDDMLYRMFGEFDESFKLGYVIDNLGYIHIGTTALEHFTYLDDELIHISSISAELWEYVHDLVNVQGRFFTAESRTETFHLYEGEFSIAAVTPIANSDWMVVALFHSGALFEVSEILPFVLVIIAALILYMAIGTTITRHYVLTPLAGLMKSITKNTSACNNVDDMDLYGVERNDEFGVLARNIYQTQHNLLQREKLLNTVNKAAEVLLTASEENTMTALMEGMEIVGRCIDADRVQIWRNEMIDDELHFVMRYEWLSELGKQKIEVPIGLKFPYSEIDGWLEMFSRGESINSPISKLSQKEAEFLGYYEMVSIVCLPLFTNGEFIGFFSVDDCQYEKAYTDDEMNMFASAGLMFTNVFNRTRQKELADTDSLTGAYNRRYFTETATAALHRSIEESHDFSVIITDIDYFKSINDRYGHAVGDEVLIIFTARIRHVLKQDTLLARYGGEEFVINLEGVNQENAIKTALRLNKTIHDTPFRVGDLDLNITASFGVASKTSVFTALPEIINNADKALYQAKSAGRNTVVGYTLASNPPGRGA